MKRINPTIPYESQLKLHHHFLKQLTPAPPSQDLCLLLAFLPQATSVGSVGINRLNCFVRCLMSRKLIIHPQVQKLIEIPWKLLPKKSGLCQNQEVQAFSQQEAGMYRNEKKSAKL